MSDASPLHPASQRFLGIDFSGNFRMWRPRCGKTNVWIAEVESQACGPKLIDLRPVQKLDGECDDPFAKLVQRLRRSDFDAAAIDAPFAVPADYMGSRKHRELLTLVAMLERPAGRPFPSASTLVSCLLAGRPKTKPLRQTEEYWQQKPRRVNVRSTLWHGPRGGAAMTAACLQLLAERGSPIWPWESTGRGLLIEAFPAAQLCHWGVPYQAYSRKTGAETANRYTIVQVLAARIDLQHFRKTLEQCADALDAVICAFAAMAVVNDRRLRYLENAAGEEGLIAVARD